MKRLFALLLFGALICESPNLAADPVHTDHVQCYQEQPTSPVLQSAVISPVEFVFTASDPSILPFIAVHQVNSFQFCAPEQRLIQLDSANATVRRNYSSWHPVRFEYGLDKIPTSPGELVLVLKSTPIWLHFISNYSPA